MFSVAEWSAHSSKPYRAGTIPESVDRLRACRVAGSLVAAPTAKHRLRRIAIRESLSHSVE